VMIAAHATTPLRPYSIAAAPEDADRDQSIELLMGVDQDGRAGPNLPLAPQGLVDVDGPVGRFVFPDHPEVNRFLFIAGGTGIAPLRAMLRHALRVPHREIGVLYSARTAADFAYEAELEDLERAGDIELRQTITREDNAAWTKARGRIGHEELRPLVHGRETLCFICGPLPLVTGMSNVLKELGVPPHRVRTEEWGG
jgi:ferredoxin-NADP reductase